MATGERCEHKLISLLACAVLAPQLNSRSCRASKRKNETYALFPAGYAVTILTPDQAETLECESLLGLNAMGLLMLQRLCLLRPTFSISSRLTQ